MDALAKYAEAIYNGFSDSIKKRHLYTAYLQLHVENPGLHPDDYKNPEGGYQGWHVLLVDQVWTAASLPDNFRYPCAFLRGLSTMESFESFHADDDDATFTDYVLVIKEFLTDFDTKTINHTAECAMNLYLYHATEDEDNEMVNDLRDISDVLTWISQFS